MNRTPEEIALEVLAALQSGDFENLKPLLSENVAYEDPRFTRRGIAALKGVFEAHRQSYREIAYDILAVTCEGSSAVVERVERYTLEGQRFSLDVVATFELDHAGKLERFVQSFDSARPIAT